MSTDDVFAKGEQYAKTLSDAELWAKAEEHADALQDLLLPKNRHKAKKGMPYWLVLGFLVGALTTITRELSKRGEHGG